MNQPRPTFEQFLHVFPEVELPVTLTESLHHELEKANSPFAQVILLSYVQPADMGEIDEYTEYMPGFKVTTEKAFKAVVFWKAGLMVYEYILATFTPKGELIASAVISRVEAKDGVITQAATVITQEWVIYVSEGKVVTDEFDATQSINYSYEVLPNGEIVRYGEDEFL
ncbi:MAG TPA: hypothetical protein ENK85_05595 [Saprospiraceae bacterium]|nr:hypothetical protein [Saprospiraceae bacterium]